MNRLPILAAGRTDKGFGWFLLLYSSAAILRGGIDETTNGVRNTHDDAAPPSFSISTTVSDPTTQTPTPALPVAKAAAARQDDAFTYPSDWTPLDIGALRPPPEPLGPSTRRGGLVISEILFQPGVRADQPGAQFIEIFNTLDLPQDLTGWRLGGDVEHAFAANTVLAPRGFLVLTPTPREFLAAYPDCPALDGIAALPKKKGRLQLKKPTGGIVFDVEYSARPPFPAAAAGGGHSLVLARPSYGESYPEAWAASERVGGSPGGFEPAREPAYRTVLINELLARPSGDQTEFVELFNYSTQAVDLAGCVLTDDPAQDGCVLPTGTILPAKGFVAFDKARLGFGLKDEGETVFLFTPDRSRVIDAWRFDAQAPGVALGRYPDGAPQRTGLQQPTPGAANSSPWESPVVINEIMYAPLSGNPDDEYVELYNRGASAVDLGGWSFAAGIDFTFPPGTAIPADGYLVVARNRERLLSLYEQLNLQNTVGNFQGALANSGERLALAMPQDTATPTNASPAVVANEVAWRGGGRWPELAHAGGSSLELIDPRADNRCAANWAASDESAKSAWTTIEASYPPSAPRPTLTLSPGQLQVQMLGAGECLLDHVELFVQGDTNVVPNADFAAGLTNWFCQGNHSPSTLEQQGGESGGPCLRIRATGRGDTGANRIRVATPKSSKPGPFLTLRARARWLSGWPEILLRIRGLSYEASGRLDTPRNPGTPGSANSRRVANTGPAIADVTPDPVLPAAGQDVTVRARIADPAGLGEPSLNYRVDPDTNYTRVPLTYRGAGLFSGVIPGQTTGAVVAFYLQASNGRTPATVSRYPADAPERECVIRFGDPTPPGHLGVYRIWLTDRTARKWENRERLSNDPLDATFVYNDSRVIYNVGVVGAGSPFLTEFKQSPLKSDDGCVIHCPPDDRCLNATDLTLDYGGYLDMPFEQAALWVMNGVGVHGGYRRVIRCYINGNLKGAIRANGASMSGLFEDCLQPNGDVVDEEYPSDTEGDLYKIDDRFEFDDQAVTFSNTDATLRPYTNSLGGKVTALYRWNWRKRAVHGSANDFTSLFALVDAVNPKAKTGFTPAEFAALEALVDLEQWTRVLAVERVIGNYDSYGLSRGKNMYAYKPRQGKWVLWPWDMDTSFSPGFEGSSHPLDPTLIPPTDPSLTLLLKHPPVHRLLLRAAREAVEGPLSRARFGAFIDAYEKALKTNGFPQANVLASLRNRTAVRYTQLSTALAGYDVPFSPQSGGGQSNPTTNGSFLLKGTAPLTVYAIQVNGQPLSLDWITPTNWSARVVLKPGHNALQVTGTDRWGNLLTNAPAALNVVYTPVPPLLAGEWKPDLGFTVTWRSVPGARYRLQAASELPEGSWTDVGDPVLATGDTASQTDSLPSIRQRFYRLVTVE